MAKYRTVSSLYDLFTYQDVYLIIQNYHHTTMLKIVQAPAPVLAEKAKKIETIDTATQKLIKEMIKTLEAATDPEGVGLAAPQVGKSVRLFIVKETPTSEVMVCINPEIKSLKNKPPVKTKNGKNAKKSVKLEGCLSLQDVWGVVNRADEVVLSYTDEKGDHHKKTFTGFLAVIIQHEFDHIEGILFPRRVLEQNEKLYKASKDSSGELVFEELSL